MLFPKWLDKLTPIFLWGGIVGLLGVIFVFWYWFSPKSLNVGYQPEQPIPYNHQLHVGQLGLDCRYCHYTVEQAAHAAIPPTEVCMNCHTLVKTNSENIKKVAASYENEEPIDWVKVHNLPDYAYFNHSRHVAAGVGCVECHGRIDQMEIVYQAEPLSMGWCLECHRNPAGSIRPVEFVTDMEWSTEDPVALGHSLIAANNIKARQDCNTCHR
ncbi:hypothetical protein COTS27_01667 [Spirochaetota bacterium]|nr:hypothetical protein COTS27_01667 [Spirochaetota bacterium]